ncbi:MAG TPA: ABC transporter permease [Chryseolinea sp.]|nr:ABC transporter permease [Chryseolinea sp.]
MLKNYLAIAVRNLLKYKLFLFINVLGLGVAIACCIVAFLNIDFNENFDRQHFNARNIYRVQFWNDYEGTRNRYAVAPTPLGNIIKQNFADVTKVVRYTVSSADIRIGNELFNTRLSYADSAFFEFFSFGLKDGSFEDFQDKSKIFISEKLASTYFNAPLATGKQITQVIDGNLVEFTVGGVFENQPLNSSFQFDAITLWDNYQNTTLTPVSFETDWKVMNTLFLWIDDPSRTSAVTQQMQKYIEPQNRAREDLKVTEYYLQCFEGLALSFHDGPWLNGDQLNAAMPPYSVLAPAIIATLLLLLGCFNFTNTSIAISSRRIKEIGIRKVLGGSKKQLVLQLLTDTMILITISVGVGLVLAHFLVPAYNSMWPSVELSLDFSGNGTLLIFLGCLLLITTIVAGSYSAFYITSFKPISVLKGNMKTAGTNWFTRILLGLQFSIALLSLVFGYAYIRNAEYQRDYDLGYLTKGIITVPVTSGGDFNAYRNALLVSKDIEVVAGSRNHVSDDFYKAPVKYEGTEHQAEVIDVGEAYLEAMDIAILQGRGFQKESESDREEAVLVSEEFVRQFAIKNPIGQRILFMDSLSLYIIGVTKDIYPDAFWRPVGPVMLRQVGPERYNHLVVRTAPEHLMEVNEFMKKEWNKLFPTRLYAGKYSDGNVRITEMINTNVIKIFGFLGVIAVLMSTTGLFSLVSLNIVRKLKEIGVRKVLGASTGNIIWLIGLEFIIILSFAATLGSALGYLMVNKMMNAVWEYYLEVNYATLEICVAFLLSVAIATVGIKVFRTTLLNPVNVLREE